MFLRRDSKLGTMTGDERFPRGSLARLEPALSSIIRLRNLWDFRRDYWQLSQCGDPPAAVRRIRRVP